MLRRLHPDQPESFAFTPDNQAWAEAQMTKFPEGRQASAIIPLLWRAQEQEGWLTRPAIETVADMLGMAYIRALEVATFYFMFQLQPVGSVAHVQVCGTTSCMICGAEDLIAVCKDKIAPKAHELSADGKLSWEEVECLGACSNAPMAQIGKDYYEDLTAETFAEILDQLTKGEVPLPGSRKGRFASEPESGATSLTDGGKKLEANASVTLAKDIGDSIKRIDGTEVPLRTPWTGESDTAVKERPAAKTKDTTRHEGAPVDKTGVTKSEAPAETKAKPDAEPATERPQLFDKKPKDADDLQQITGVGPKLEKLMHKLGIYKFSQIAAWTPEQVAWVDGELSFKGRIERDDWIAQAKDLMKKDAD